MSESDSLPPRQSTSPQRARRSGFLAALGRFLSEWRVELLIGLLVAVAIFLLVERMQIRQMLLGYLRQGLSLLESFGGSLAQRILSFLRNTSLSDLTGYVLLLVAVVVVAWRARWRLLTTRRFSEMKCPRCGGEVHRVHRRPIDHLVSLFVPVARYRCRSRDCRWIGLRIKRIRHE